MTLRGRKDGHIQYHTMLSESDCTQAALQGHHPAERCCMTLRGRKDAHIQYHTMLSESDCTQAALQGQHPAERCCMMLKGRKDGHVQYNTIDGWFFMSPLPRLHHLYIIILTA